MLKVSYSKYGCEAVIFFTTQNEFIEWIHNNEKLGMMDKDIVITKMESIDPSTDFEESNKTTDLHEEPIDGVREDEIPEWKDIQFIPKKVDEYLDTHKFIDDESVTSELTLESKEESNKSGFVLHGPHTEAECIAFKKRMSERSKHMHEIDPAYSKQMNEWMHNLHEKQMKKAGYTSEEEARKHRRYDHEALIASIVHPEDIDKNIFVELEKIFVEFKSHEGGLEATLIDKSDW